MDEMYTIFIRSKKHSRVERSFGPVDELEILSILKYNFNEVTEKFHIYAECTSKVEKTQGSWVFKKKEGK